MSKTWFEFDAKLFAERRKVAPRRSRQSQGVEGCRCDVVSRKRLKRTEPGTRSAFPTVSNSHRNGNPRQSGVRTCYLTGQSAEGRRFVSGGPCLATMARMPVTSETEDRHTWSGVKLLAVAVYNYFCYVCRIFFVQKQPPSRLFLKSRNEITALSQFLDYFFARRFDSSAVGDVLFRGERSKCIQR